jgi:hypothetical protein
MLDWDRKAQLPVNVDAVYEHTFAILDLGHLPASVEYFRVPVGGLLCRCLKKQPIEYPTRRDFSKCAGQLREENFRPFKQRVRLYCRQPAVHTAANRITL